MTVLETERLCLHFLEASDLDALAAIYADAEVMRFVGGPLNRDETWLRLLRIQEFYRRRRCGPYATRLKSSGDLVGRCGFLFWTLDGRDEVEVAYLLARRFWGQGLATEAVRAIVRYGFEQMRFTRMISLIQSDNLASIRVAQKAGMKLQRNCVLPDHGLRLMFAVERG